MKMIILAAGQGTRLRPLTDDKPKCMVEYQGKPIIDYILETAAENSIKDIALVTGYKKEVLEKYLQNHDIQFYTNINFATTNMVYTLFCAKEFMNDDIVISYADIVYSKDVLKKLLASDANFSVVVDKRWQELWSQRMENPLDDAETLKIKDGYIIELGKQPTAYSEIEGQYIGLIKISKEIINSVITYYESLDRDKLYDGKDFDNMYMTSFIQFIINYFLPVQAVLIDGGWVEIDEISDLNAQMIKV